MKTATSQVGAGPDRRFESDDCVLSLDRNDRRLSSRFDHPARQIRLHQSQTNEAISDWIYVDRLWPRFRSACFKAG